MPRLKHSSLLTNGANDVDTWSCRSKLGGRFVGGSRRCGGSAGRRRRRRKVGRGVGGLRLVALLGAPLQLHRSLDLVRVGKSLTTMLENSFFTLLYFAADTRDK